MPLNSNYSHRKKTKRHYRMEREIKMLREQVQELKETVKDLQDSLPSYEKDIDELDSRVHDLKNRVMDEFDDKDLTKKNFANIKKVLKDRDNRIKGLENNSKEFAKYMVEFESDVKNILKQNMGYKRGNTKEKIQSQNV